MQPLPWSMGFFFFLILMLLEKSFGFSQQKNIGKLVFTYQLGLNITSAGFLMRGMTQVWEISLSRGMDAPISGISGLGHILMSVSMIFLLIKIKKAGS